jgi:hypothetical protein
VLLKADISATGNEVRFGLLPNYSMPGRRRAKFQGTRTTSSWFSFHRI